MNIPWRVYQGMLWLDKNRPNWWKQIHLRSLNIQDQRTCVIGQLYGGIKPRANLANLGLDAYTDMVNGKHPSRDDMSLEMWYLTAEWKRQIQLRRETQ